MAQRGAVRLGALPLSASGDNIKGFETNMPSNPISYFIVTATFGVKNAANATSTFVVSTGSSAAAEGVDDLDLILNALFTKIIFLWTAGDLAGQLTPAQWRTILGLFNKRDFEGSLVNTAPIPASASAATTYTVVMRFPCSLQTYFPDGAIFTQGGDHLRTGQFDFVTGSSLTPTVVCANCSVVISGLALDFKVQIGSGTGGDIGPTWRVLRQTNLTLPFQFSSLERLALLDTTPVATYSGDVISFLDNMNMSPAFFQQKFQAEVLGAFGNAFDISARTMPYFWRNSDFRFDDLAAHFGRDLVLDVASGITSTNVYDVQMHAPQEATVSRVGTRVGGGGAVSTARVAPSSVGAGGAVPGYLHPYLPIRVLPGAVGGASAAVHASPQAAAGAVAETRAKSQSAKGILGGLFRNR